MEVVDNENIIKVILLGESRVGKTAIINRFAKDIYENTLTTIGALSVHKTYTINDITIKYEIWDTAGQERFRTMGRQFYKDADIGIIVYDITNNKSFREIDKFWYQELIENSPKDIGNYYILYNKILFHYSCCNCWK